jgi:hypothetical protein
MTTGDEPVNLAEGDWPDDETLDPHSAAAPAPAAARPVGGMPAAPVPVPRARPGVRPTVRWVAVAAAAAGVMLLARRFRHCRGRRRG